MRKQILVRRTAQTALALALAAGFSAVACAQTQTHTTLTAETRDQGSQSTEVFSISVAGEDGQPVTGAIRLTENGKDVAGAALNAESQATITLNGLAAGDHTLTAIYVGDGAHAASASQTVTLHPLTAATPDFSIALAPAALSVKAGSNATSVMTVLPVNGFTGFLSLSCSGLPVGASCTFTPANLQLTSTTSATTGVTAQLSMVTTAPAGQNAKLNEPTSRSPLVLAILLPGVVGLGFLGRKRNLLGRVALLLMVATIGIAGTTACNPRYYYLNHPPTYNGGTPVGTYTVTVSAQASNGVSATLHTTPLALTVN